MQPRHATLSGHESIAKILRMEFMPGPLPLPLGQKEEDERVTGKGSTSGGSGGALEPPRGWKRIGVCSANRGSQWQVGPKCWAPLGAYKVEVQREEAGLLRSPS